MWPLFVYSTLFADIIGEYIGLFDEYE